MNATLGVERTFRFRVAGDQQRMRQALEQGEPQGEADILIAVFDVPDTHISFGNSARQVIDRGAFRTWLETSPFPMPFFLDHGDAIAKGVHYNEFMIGEVRAGKETDEGLLIHPVYDLESQRGKEAFGRVLRFPGVVGFSFGDDLDREVVRRDEAGTEHLVEMWPFEFSQVGFGAQQGAKLIAARTAIASHSTETAGGDWDAAAQERQYSAPYARYYAWRDPEGDQDAKSSFKFPHHLASSGAASLRGCVAGIGVLNGGRGGTDIPSADRQGVYNHLARHLRDADREPPALRSAPWQPEEIRELMGEAGFKQALGELMVSDPEMARQLRSSAERALAPPEDPVWDFYRDWARRARTSTPS